MILALAVTAGVPLPVLAANGDCAQPVSSGSNPVASDCLFILRTAVGSNTCDPECVCAPGGSVPAKASDALLCLRKSVGQQVTLNCPCSTLPDSDNFNDNARDPAKWAADDENEGNGALVEAGARLEYRCNNGTDFDQGLRTWIGSAFPYDQDWDVQVDVANTTAPATQNQISSFGVSIVDESNFGNEVFAELYASGSEGAYNGFYAAIYEDDDFAGEVDTDALTATTGAIRIEFEALTKVLTLFYDIDPANGYSWVKFGSFSVDDLGGDDADADWGMTSSGQFEVSLYGFSASMSVSAGKVFGDNFVTHGGEE